MGMSLTDKQALTIMYQTLLTGIWAYMLLPPVHEAGHIKERYLNESWKEVT